MASCRHRARRGCTRNAARTYRLHSAYARTAGLGHQHRGAVEKVHLGRSGVHSVLPTRRCSRHMRQPPRPVDDFVSKRKFFLSRNNQQYFQAPVTGNDPSQKTTNTPGSCGCRVYNPHMRNGPPRGELETSTTGHS
uniref:Uncharacterized protein n=1 Tax=Sipha flava TaxID=143950 RepID=A0A2S2R3H1_9HEMI